jgi:thioesterase domain-containing protein
LEHNAAHAMVLVRRHGLVCPAVIDYINLVRPFTEDFEHKTSGSGMVINMWRQAYDGAPAQPPETWQRGVFRPDGHSVSVSDIYFVGHHACVISSNVGLTRRMLPDGLETEERTFHAATVVVKCVGFRVNEGNERLLGRACMGADSVVAREVQVSVEPHLDEASNGLPLIGYVNAINFGAKWMARSFVRKDVYVTARPIQPLVRVNHVTASQASDALMRTAASDPSAHALLTEHVHSMAADCQSSWSPEEYLECNTLQWDALNGKLHARGHEGMQYPFGNALRVLELESPESLQALDEVATRHTPAEQTGTHHQEATVSEGGRPALDPESVLDFVVSQLAQNISDPSLLGPDVSIAEVGLDSLAAGAFVGALRQELGLETNLQALLDGQATPRSLAGDVLTSATAEGLTDEAALPNEAPLYFTKQITETSVATGTARSWASKISFPIVFVFSSPRSGSTLLQLILSVHGELRAVQELHLLVVADIGEWRQWFMGTVFADTLFDTMAQLEDAADGRRLVDAWPASMPIRDVYETIQGHVAPKVLVDKTPSNAAHPAFIRRARIGWQHASLVHLYRHPVAVIPSVVELMEKIYLVQGLTSTWSQAERFAAAEHTWVSHTRNVLDLLQDDCICLRYESLVTNPEETLRRLCHSLGIAWEPAMLDPYGTSSKMSDNTFRTSSRSGIIIGDDKIFKRTSIEAAQADKWRSVALPASLALSSIATARLLGYDEFPLHLAPELVWLRAPEYHSSEPPLRLLLCIHSVSGKLDNVQKIVSQLSLPCLGLQLTSRMLSGAQSVADVEQRYWMLTSKQMKLWRDNDPHQQRLLLGESFGCRIAFSFAGRLDVAGCADIRLIIIDGRVAHQPVPEGLPDDPQAKRMADALVAKHGTEAFEMMRQLAEIINSSTDYEAFRLKDGVLSERVGVLHLKSEQPPPNVQLPELAMNVEVVTIPGMHFAALDKVARGESARAMAKRFEAFLEV